MLPNRPTELFGSAELMSFEAMRTRIVRHAKAGFLVAAKASLATLTLCLVFAIEYSAFKDVYDFLKAPLPGEEALFSPAVLALTGAIMVLALHLRAAMAPDSLPVRLMDRAVDILLPLYMIGAGLMFSGILFFDGADGMFATAADSFNVFGAPADNTPSLLTTFLEKAVAPTFSIVFVLGAGAVVVISVFVGHRCLLLIEASVSDLFGRVRDAREAVAAHREVLEHQEAYRRTNGELQALTRARERDLSTELAAEIGSVIDDELKPYQLFINDRRINPEPNPYEPRRDLNLTELEKRVRAIESITPQEIMAAMRGELEKESTYETAFADASFDDDGNGYDGRGDAYARH
jgi:hypothetical protein